MEMENKDVLEILFIRHAETDYDDWEDIEEELTKQGFQLDGIDEELLLMSPEVIEPIQNLKVNHLGNINPRLHTDETLIALSICANTSPEAKCTMEQLSKLKGCEVHSTVILSSVDEITFKRLGVNLTCEPKYQ